MYIYIYISKASSFQRHDHPKVSPRCSKVHSSVFDPRPASILGSRGAAPGISWAERGLMVINGDLMVI